MDFAEAWIGFVDGAAGIVEDAQTGRVFEEERAIVATELSGVAAERRHTHEACLTLLARHWQRAGGGDEHE
jgi:hypothetical protein